jgi:hypothetical protein
MPTKKLKSLPARIHQIKKDGVTKRSALRCSNQFGHVLVTESAGGHVPVYIGAKNKGAEVDLRSNRMSISFGKGQSAIRCDSKGFSIEGGQRLEWNKSGIKRLLEAICRDPVKANGALELRAAYHTNMPALISSAKSARSKAGVMVGPGTMIALPDPVSMSRLGATSIIECTTTTITDTVYETITRSVDLIRTAEERFNDCLGDNPDLGRYLYCVAQSFVDMVVGVRTIVEQVATEVTRTVVTCVAGPRPAGSSPYGVPTQPFSDHFPGVAFATPDKPAPKASDIQKAIKELSNFVEYFGSIGGVLLGGKWDLAKLVTPIDVGDGKLEVPYGVKVTLVASEAEKLMLSRNIIQAATAVGSTLSVLAALSPEFAAAAVAFGVVAAPLPAPVLTFLAANPAVATAAIVIVCFILLMLYWAVAVGAELDVHKLLGSFADGKLSIEHPSIALGAIALAFFAFGGINVALIVPPIVTG